MENLELLKVALSECIETRPYPIINPSTKEVQSYVVSKMVGAIPYLHREDNIALLFCGFEIILNKDGTWSWQDTTGG